MWSEFSLGDHWTISFVTGSMHATKNVPCSYHSFVDRQVTLHITKIFLSLTNLNFVQILDGGSLVLLYWSLATTHVCLIIGATPYIIANHLSTIRTFVAQPSSWSKDNHSNRALDFELGTWVEAQDWIFNQHPLESFAISATCWGPWKWWRRRRCTILAWWTNLTRKCKISMVFQST